MGQIKRLTSEVKERILLDLIKGDKPKIIAERHSTSPTMVSKLKTKHLDTVLRRKPIQYKLEI